MSDIKLNAQNISFSWNEKLIFDELTFDLSPGEILEIHGANGSGKSTLLRILSGLLEPDHGNVLWDGKSIFNFPEDYRAQINYSGHQSILQPHLTVYENLKLACALADSTPQEQTIRQTLSHLKLDYQANQPAFYLSAGQARRVNLARLLLNPSALWILDEPGDALDQEGHQFLLDLLHQHSQQGGIAVIATHQNFDLKNKKTLWLGHQDD